jgi:uncharacterized protein YndB with AHSA1/START domain
MAEYKFLTVWRIAAPRQRVWDVLMDGRHYPDWWSCYKQYRSLNAECSGVGAQSELVVRGLLPYDVRYLMDVSFADPPRELIFSASGDLVGEGRMVFQAEGEGTVVHLHWNVRTTGFWMNLLAPALRWAFVLNHNWVMRRGERGLVKWLKTGANAVPADSTS